MNIFDKVTEEGEDLFSVFDSSSSGTGLSKKRKDTTEENNNNSTKNADEPVVDSHEQWLKDIENVQVKQKHPKLKGVYQTVTKKAKTEENGDSVSKDDAISITADVEKSAKTTNNQDETEIITCLHEVCLPPETDGVKREIDPEILHPKYPPADPARTWPFNLDPFQKKSVAILERNESVLVSAHTSAGKTVIAEYAIAKSLKNNQRVVYTSPIKALSNQKYREFLEIFSDVGLMTGDITINPSASCLVMTTEILRSMLYRGSEVIREVAWVVFDEIHYMRDKERGVVWEETIILLPDKVHYVFLSATIPNAKEFASWIAKIHSQPCHVVYTEYRPTPLQHYIFPSGGDGLHLVVDEKGIFREDNFQKALSSLVLGPEQNKRRGGKKNNVKGGSDIFKIVKMIMERNYQPVIVFSFSKKECEALALQMSKLDLSTPDEKKLIEKVYANAIDSLNEDDKKLPQVAHILPLLKRGVGIHHSGLLPLLKEVIEILFQEGLIKALFATETFSIGLNMPAKTVVFTSVRKFDGENFRWVTSGEYIQMSGRAGRRGLDDRGIVILMVDEKMEPATIKSMVKGAADSLYSSFYIGYNMLLNLLRVEGFSPEYLLKRSFHQYQTSKSLPEHERRAIELEKEKEQISIQDEEVVAEYAALQDQLKKLRTTIRDVVTQPIHIVPFLQPGRLVKVKESENDWGWGVVVNFQKLNEKGAQSVADNLSAKYIIDVLLPCIMDPSTNKPKPAGTSDQPTVQVIPVTLPVIEAISSVRVYIPDDLRPLEKRQSVGKTIKEVQKRFPDGIPMLDPLEDMKIEDSDFKKVIRKVEMIEDKLNNTSGFKGGNMKERYEQYQNKIQLDDEIKSIRKFLKQSEDVIMKHELKCMKRVLRRMGYVTQEDVIETKGRVACEISAADELLITELMFAGFFNDLSIEVIVSVLSCFIFEEKSDANMKLREELAAPLRQVQETARRIAKLSQECKLKIDIEEYVKQTVNPAMMEITFAWAKGAKFVEICGMSDIFEGSIIRALRRLEELLRELGSAAKAIGNTELENKFADGTTKIKRDIVFAASLYL